jgi:hypothetical protein
VALTHAELNDGADSRAGVLGILDVTKGDPHGNARFTTGLAAMLVDARALLHRRFSASGLGGTCREQGVTAFKYMGAMSVLLLWDRSSTP